MPDPVPIILWHIGFRRCTVTRRDNDPTAIEISVFYRDVLIRREVFDDDDAASAFAIAQMHLAER